MNDKHDERHMHDNGSQRRILEAILLLAGQEMHGLAPKDLATGLKVSPASVTRDLHNLVTAGFAEQIAETGRYRLGPGLVRIAIAHATAMERAQQRLAESLETAMHLADGRALVIEVDSGTEHLFNARFACPLCSYTIAELEPRLFSFNSPQGACPSCDGLGHQEVFDPARVVAFLRSASPVVPSRDGTDAMPITSACWRAWPSITASTWRRRLKTCRRTCAR